MAAIDTVFFIQSLLDPIYPGERTFQSVSESIRKRLTCYIGVDRILAVSCALPLAGTRKTGITLPQERLASHEDSEISKSPLHHCYSRDCGLQQGVRLKRVRGV